MGAAETVRDSGEARESAVDACASLDLEAVFADPVLRQKVLAAIEAPAGTAVVDSPRRVTCRDLVSIQRLVVTANVTSLAGIERLTGLTELTLGERFDYYEPSRAPRALPGAELLRLRSLATLTRLSLGPVETLEAVASLVQLQELNVDAVESADLGPLRGLSRLRVLQIGTGDPRTWKGWDDGKLGQRTVGLLYAMDRAGEVADLEPLAGLSSLRVLEITGAKVASLAPLAGLETLEILNLRKNLVRDLGPLGALSRLELLLLDDNQISDLTALASCAGLRELHLAHNPIVDVHPLAANTSLEKVFLGATGVRDARPLAVLPGLKVLNLCASPALVSKDWKVNRPVFDALRRRGVSAPGFVACTCC
jgi:internalin A